MTYAITTSKGVNLIKMYDKEDSKAQQCFLVLIINMIISIEYCCIVKISDANPVDKSVKWVALKKIMFLFLRLS